MKSTLKEGTITILFREEIVEIRHYISVSERLRVIEFWKKVYKPKWEKMVFQINPKTDTTRINEDGTNIKYKYKKHNFENPILAP